MLRQEEEINKRAKERENTRQHVAMKMHAKGMNVPLTRARQAIWDKWQTCPPYA